MAEHVDWSDGTCPYCGVGRIRRAVEENILVGMVDLGYFECRTCGQNWGYITECFHGFSLHGRRYDEEGLRERNLRRRW